MSRSNHARAGHRYNLWFAAGARDRRGLDDVLARIAADVGQKPLDLPLEREYRVDTGPPLGGPRRAGALGASLAPPPRPNLDEGLAPGSRAGKRPRADAVALPRWRDAAACGWTMFSSAWTTGAPPA
jgi:hypothetical protein